MRGIQTSMPQTRVVSDQGLNFQELLATLARAREVTVPAAAARLSRGGQGPTGSLFCYRQIQPPKPYPRSRVNPQVQKSRGGQDVATLGRPHCQDVVGSGPADSL